MTDKTDPKERREAVTPARKAGRLVGWLLSRLTLLSGVVMGFHGLPEGLEALVVPALWVWTLVGLAYATTALCFRLAKGRLVPRSNGDYPWLLWRLVCWAPLWHLLSTLLLAALYLDGRPVLAGLHALRMIASFLLTCHRETGGPLAPA